MEALGIDGKLLLAQGINFLIFYFIFNRYIAKPFGKFLKKERQLEEEKNLLMSNLRKGEEQRKEQEIQMKKELRAQTEVEMKKMREQAEAMRAEIVTKAEKEASEILHKTQLQLDAERDQLHTEVKKKVGELSLVLISKGLHEYLTPDLKKQLTNHILNNLDH